MGGGTWRFGFSCDLCKVMAYKKKIDEKTKWYVKEIPNPNGDDKLFWQLQKPTVWKIHVRTYRILNNSEEDPDL
jgi:hypothetical protein